jgi:hypothetical protein
MPLSTLLRVACGALAAGCLLPGAGPAELERLDLLPRFKDSVKVEGDGLVIAGIKGPGAILVNIVCTRQP